MVALIELQEPPAAMLVGSHIPPPPPEPAPPQIMSTTFEARGVCLGPQQLKELKVLMTEKDKQRSKAMADKDWCSLLDCGQYLFGALSIQANPPTALPQLCATLLAPTRTS